MVNTSLRLLSVFLLSCILSGCGLIDYVYLPPSDDTAQELFENGNDAMRDKNYVEATQQFTKLKENFPFSPYVAEAELSLADAFFLDTEWDLAIEAYKEFEALHPRHEAIPYVLYNIAMANVNAYPSIDRAPQPIEEAYSYFNRVRESYPGTEYAIASQEKMQDCRSLLAQHEMYVADFFYRMGRYGSALIRYKNIMRDFSDVPDVYANAELKAKSAFIYDREQKAEETRQKREGSWKDLLNWL